MFDSYLLLVLTALKCTLQHLVLSIYGAIVTMENKDLD